jgi:hypothetical protein
VEKFPKNHITEKAIAWKKESMDQIQDEDDIGNTTTQVLDEDTAEPGVHKSSVSPLMEKKKDSVNSTSDLDF